MRLLWSLFSIAIAFHAAGVTAGKERRSTLSGTPAIILTPDFVNTLQEIVDAGGVQGLTLAIVNKTGPAELGAWGVKSENGTKMTTDTLFNLASCSKAFLSASPGIVIDDFAHGRNATPLPAGLSTLTWKTKVADILPGEWKLTDHWASKKANLIDILTHLSGVASHDYALKKNDSVSDITKNLRNFRPTFELREQWLYTNQMYIVGANVVTTLTGMCFADFVELRIFKPLGMSSSTYSIDAALRTGRFTDSWTSFGRLIQPWIEEKFVDLVAGSDGVMSSVEDLVLLNGGIDPNTNVTIIPPASAQFEVITSAHSIEIPSVNAQVSTEVYGLGWSRFSYIAHDIIGHIEDAPGVSISINAALEDGIAIVVLANADSKGTPISDIISAAAKKAFGLADDSSSSPASTNQSSTSRRSKVPRHHARVTIRTEAQPPPDGVDLTGTYYNAGYGTGVLCSVHSSSPSCESVLHAFRSIDPSLSSNSSDLFASWDTLLSTHVRFVYTNASQYVIYIGSIYAQGYGKNTMPFSTLEPGGLRADFVVENGTVVGFGWSDVSDVGVKRAGSVEETSDVWFVKEA